MQKKALAVKTLDGLKPAPKGQRITIADAALPGFQVRVTEHGVRSFSFRYRFQGRQRRVSCGTYPATKLSEAHGKARAILKALEQGLDPEAAATVPAPTVTVRTVAYVVDRFVSEYLDENDRRTALEIEQVLRRDLVPALGDHDIRAVERSEIEDVLATVRDRARKRARDRVSNRAAERVYKEAAAEERHLAAQQGRGPEYRNARRRAELRAQAAREAVKGAADLEAKRAGVYVNRVHAVIRKFWNWAAEEKQYTTSSPAKFKRKMEERQRDRLLSPEEIRALWTTCSEVHPAFGDIVKLLLLTGQRLSEIAAMAWSEIHEETGELRLSGARTKNERAHVVPFPPSAIAIVAGRDKIDGCPYVFSTTDKSPVSGFSKWKEELDRRLGFKTPWRLHDLRHVAATGLAGLEVDPHVIEAVLNHASGFKAGVAGRYNQFSYLREKRAALARWAAHLERLIAPTSGKIVPLPRAVAAASA